LIIGGGPIGLTLGLVLRARGARKIYITEPTTTRRAQAAEVADRVLNPAEENVGNVIRSLTEGKGADVVFDCAGIQPGAEDGMNAIARCGTYINIAGWGGPFTIPQRNFMFKEVTMKGSMSYTEHDFKQTVEAFNNGMVFHQLAYRRVD
jgi:threonine dehydrogenase-like Zn-dependent dehydrogenase